MQDISNLMGDVFEEICKEYMIRLAKERKLPFIPYHLGKWWGSNPLSSVSLPVIQCLMMNTKI